MSYNVQTFKRSNVAIRVENLSKRYRIGHAQKRHDTLRDAIAETFQRFNVSTFSRSNDDFIWALKDVSFEIQRGEVVGIIGRNGAGKSTLLKILSRITKPTEGSADIFGRVGSLLEVGTGFHAELTGRENIYLSGAILGMRKREIDRKFDEIVAFAEVEKFIDTPVKHYSSGMYVRLAFAVAAHLEPEILLVDEVLAVGDAAFQKKCLGKMGDVAKEGRTVLFVSHNMAAVGRLCTSAFWLDAGKIVEHGVTQSVVRAYLASSESIQGHIQWDSVQQAPGDEFVRAVSVSILDAERRPNPTLHQGESFIISIVYRVLKTMMNANVGFELRADDGTVIFSSFDADNPEWSGQGRKPGLYRADCTVPAHLLNEGTCYLSLLAGIPHLRLCIKADDVLRIDIQAPVNGEGPSGRMGARRAGVIVPELAWQVTEWESS